MSAIAWIYLPFTLLSIIPLPVHTTSKYQQLIKGAFHVSNSVCIVFSVIDFEYYKFTLKRSTYDLFELLWTGNDIVMQAPTLLTGYWYQLPIIGILILLSDYLYRKIPENHINFKYSIQIPVFILVFAVFTILARGGFGLRPINIIHASQYTSLTNAPIVLNTPFTIIKTFLKSGLTKVEYFQEEEELKKWFNPVKNFSSDRINKPNIVLIILESFSNEYIGAFNTDTKAHVSYTPFLDSLIGQSLAFNHCFANGRKSIEGIPAILAGLPPLMNNPHISSHYSVNAITSLPSLLKENGYHTAFFHGGINGTMGFDVFAKSIGFDEYYGKNEYPNENDYDGNWGIFDEPYLSYFCKTLNAFKEPFFGSVFTLSSHHPYKLPDKYSYSFKGGPLEIHKTVEYTDYALKQFFKEAKTQPWFNNTLFVLTADHSSQLSDPYYMSSRGIYSIPLLFYMPSEITPTLDTSITQQTDILPSVLNFIGHKNPFYSFGNNVFNPVPEPMSVSFLSGIYQIITERCILQFNGVETIAVYDFKNDSLLNNNLIKNGYVKNIPEYYRAIETENKLKALIQTYNSAMIDNKMTVKKQ